MLKRRSAGIKLAELDAAALTDSRLALMKVPDEFWTVPYPRLFCSA